MYNISKISREFAREIRRSCLDSFLETIMKMFKITTLVAVLLVLTGCAAPFPNQIGTVSGCIPFSINGTVSQICGSGTGSTGGQQQVRQQVVVQQQRCNGPVIQYPNGVQQCRPCQSGVWNGQSCIVQQQQYYYNPRCPHTQPYINGKWMCPL